MNEEMSNPMDCKVVTITDLWTIFVQRLWIMVLVSVVSVILAFAFIKLTVAPEYSSTATLYILRQEDEEISSTDFSLALNVVNDCDYLLKSHSVLDEVIQSLELDISYDDLYDSISTANPDETRILEVTAIADTPEKAKQIVDKLCQIGPEKIKEAMGFQQVNLYEYGMIDEQPSNSFGLGGYMLVAIIAAVITYAVFLFMFLVDDIIRSKEDIERQLGLSILGEIPDADSTKKGGYYGYRRRLTHYKGDAGKGE